MIEINYGAKNIDDFCEKLKKYMLDPTFEKYGNFIHKNPKFPKNKELTEKYKGWYCLFGNFFDYSNAFSIYFNDEKLAGKIRRLIRLNQKSEAYQQAKKELAERNAHLEKMRIERLNNIIK